MIEWLRRQLLVRKGLSCGKTRRQITGDEWRTLFDENLPIRVIILSITFVAIVRIGVWHSEASIAEVLTLGTLFMGVYLLIIPLAARATWESNQLLLLLNSCLVANLLLNKGIFLVSANGESIVFGINVAPWLVPAALAPMLSSVLIGSRAGLLSAFLLAVSGQLFIDPSPGLFLSSLLMGFAASFFTQHIRSRYDLLMAGLATGLVGVVCAVPLSSLDQNTSMTYIMQQTFVAIAYGLLTSFIVSAILPILEWMFDRITDISWIELTDLNHPLLRRMSIEAPGTYNHSLMVAHLAEAAAEGIGANPTQCRASAYFHDIGKLIKPSYFVENHSEGFNPHDQLNPSMSALIIIAHVKEGVDLALKHRLRKPIIDVIQQHHGTTLVYYFYRRAIQQMEDAKAGGKILNMREEDVPEVDESSFRYPGPTPRFKECAIISLADSIESASRSLKSPTTQRIENLVRDIVQRRIEDGELDDSGLTFNEVSILIDRFSFTLKGMMHKRIEYPKGKDNADAKKKERDKDKGADLQQTKEVPTSTSKASKTG